MPIYEYQCQQCQHRLEALQKISDPALVDCPECGASALRKCISAVGFRLKGGGWYETDFKSSGKKNLAGESGKSGEAASPSTGGGEASASSSPSTGSGGATPATAP